MRRRGRVLHDDGTPAAGALVFVEASAAPVPEIAIRADSEGCFTVALPAGPAVLAARAPGGETGRASVPPAPETEIVLLVRGPSRGEPTPSQGEDP